jgi:hypothetical protein
MDLTLGTGEDNQEHSYIPTHARKSTDTHERRRITSNSVRSRVRDHSTRANVLVSVE